jgi:hypothetical protein
MWVNKSVHFYAHFIQQPPTILNACALKTSSQEHPANGITVAMSQLLETVTTVFDSIDKGLDNQTICFLSAKDKSRRAPFDQLLILSTMSQASLNCLIS